MFIQYEAKLPVRSDKYDVESMSTKYLEESFETEDKIMILVEIPSGSVLDSFELDDTGSMVKLKFTKHPMSLNPQAVQLVLHRQGVVEDSLNSERGWARRQAMETSLRKVLTKSSSKSVQS